MKSRLLIAQVAALGILGVWVAGCATDLPRELTESEAVWVAEMIGGTLVAPAMETIEEITFDGQADSQGETYDYAVDCPEGGTATFSGAIDVEFDDSSYSASSEGSVEYDSCAARTEEDVVVALTGVIDIVATIVATVSFSDQMVYISVDGSAEGSLDWEIAEEGESGTCDVDVEMEYDLEISRSGAYEVEGGVTGTVCGYVIDFDAAELELEF